MDAIKEVRDTPEIRIASQDGNVIYKLPGRYFLKQIPELPRKTLLIVRANQTWPKFLYSIPKHRLLEIAGDSAPPQDDLPTKPAEIETFLESHGIDLSQPEPTTKN